MLLSAEPVLELINADIFQEGELILDDVTFKMEKGEFVDLLGRTGCGKASLLKTLYADLSKPKGKVTVAGVSVESIKRVKIPLLRRKIGIIFQDFQLLNDRSVADNLIFVMRATGWKNSVKIKDRLNDVLMRVGLTSSMNKMPHQLSGGEQQRVVIARALLNEPVMLLADEPTGNLDPEVAEEILNLFFEINRNGTAVLMATHNHQFLLKYPARTLRVADKKVMEHAMPA